MATFFVVASGVHPHPEIITRDFIEHSPRQRRRQRSYPEL